MNGIADLHPSERLRIAHDLHHNIHRFLDKVKGHVATIVEEIKQIEAIDMGGRMTDLIAHASEDIIDSAMQTIPDIVRKEGLYFGVLHLVDKIRVQHAVEIVSKLAPLSLLSDLADIIYRIIDDHLSLFLVKKDLSKLSIGLSENSKFINLKILGRYRTPDNNILTYTEQKLNKRIRSRTKFISAVVTEIVDDEMDGYHILIPKP